MLDSELATDAERQKIPVYNDLYLQLGFPDFAMAMFTSDDGLWAVPVLKAKGQGSFGEIDATDIGALIPHFKRLIRFGNNFMLSQLSAGLNLLDQLASAAILIDPSGYVAGKNEHATAVLGGDLQIVNRRLIARHKESNAALDRYIRILNKGWSAGSLAPIQPVRIERESKRPLLIEALPTSRIFRDNFPPIGLILLVADSERILQGVEERARAAFGLTAAESRLCGLLASGKDIASAAMSLKITYGTARSQLKSILAKTDTHRQGELMLLLAALGPSHQSNVAA